jgi:formylglycine-generating enzyme required for sulfatase activity
MKLGWAILGLVAVFAGGAAMAAEALLLPVAPDPRIDLPWRIGAAPDPAFADCVDLCPEMVPVPDGEITVGSPPEEAGRTPDEVQSRVAISNLAVARFEVTRAQYAAFAEAVGHSAVAGCPTDRRRAGTWRDDAAATWRDPGFDQAGNEPVVCVSFADAQGYADWLAARTGKPYRLPTEAEFEYAARAGSALPYAWGAGAEDACAFANGRDAAFRRTYPADTAAQACDDGVLHTAPVGRFWANAFGLHDMIGNVWEWTATCFVGCERRLQRGGGWGAGPVDLRSAQRVGVLADTRDASTGFRVVRDLR